MRFSAMLIPTMREVPAEATAVSHKLMLRAGYVRQLAAGLYIYLPLGWRVIQRINAIMREEMNAIGAQEISMPVLHPSEPWEQTGRWSEIGEEMFRLKDRTGRNMALGMTHEEIMTWLAAREIRSYRQLPQVWYQIQTKLRDEARPKSGVLRTREFIMKDSYSFDINEEGLRKNYKLHEEAYHKIYSRCGLRFLQVLSDTGMMGGSIAHEFMAESPAGEDEIVICDKCGYAANIEVADSVPPKPQPKEIPAGELYTPEKRTVEEVSALLKTPPEYFIKCILVIRNEDQSPVLALVRGDEQLHEKKLAKLTGPFRAATKEEVENALGVEAGFIGPMGHENIRKIADISLKEGAFISGANKKDYHIGGIKPGDTFKAEWFDIHVARAGDGCPRCGNPLKIEKAIEIGNIFQLGTKYSVPLKAFYLDEKGEEKPVIMGSYGIGPARIAASAIEQSHDKDGIIWPESIAPFDLEVMPVTTDNPEVKKLAEDIYKELSDKGLEVLLDDRDERAGVKFKDADLIGIPKHLVIGEKNLKEGLVELKDRKTKQVEKLSPGDCVQKLLQWKNEKK